MPRVFVIAEAGVNHNGDLATAKRLISAAKESGADAVKFQTFTPASIVTRTARSAPYQSQNTGLGNQSDLLARLALPHDAFLLLFKEAKKVGIECMSTPFDVAALRYLIDVVGMQRIKISSGDLTNTPFLVEVARYRLPVILSTGMSTLEEIELALKALAFGFLSVNAPLKDDFAKIYSSKEGKEALQRKVTLLHCTTAYPTEFEDAHLNCISTIQQKFGLSVGYSDHTLGHTAAIVASALGAAIIEKHITLDTTDDGPDHKASMMPEQFKNMVDRIREAERALGSFEKTLRVSERDQKELVRRSIVAARSITKGQIISSEDLITKRPGTGTAPEMFWQIIGKKSSQDYEPDDFVSCPP